ncbi:hypothetical protein FRC04_005697 [Tulasnella sp. 424]|nr:hypothetical protein FRC04_005697 [Tulasnella sp. 424]
MTQDFTRQSHKPVGRSLLDIKVQVLPVADAIWDRADTSICKAGEWFVELICLIPIHIAVARDNRFVPLKDGVSGDSFNQDLLGSGVAEMIDLISLGPYEAILGSYMATKPVRVVSSMGEQSVGKSFSLNHLVDTSFAGSAMRTTEGVWLSLCPTKDQLVVAMDFEGVHSLERTAQEDMLLVLFNAAISNLIMFRNNFALNRNVANMFTSFQASAGLFDPDNNPKLFKGLLAIIIKDVLDADKKEIVEEFSSKFNQIVHREQGGNFITVLHDNQLAVLPWDVIRSKEFYTRFSKLSKHLFKQRSTHANAGEFLLTLKTLMAKLTAQDWGAIDHTLIKYRTSILQASLKQALISGRGEIGPFGEFEVLKNFDTQELLDTPDTNVLFYLETSDEHRQERLTELLTPLGTEPARSNLDDVRRYLDNIAEQRILHVRNWIQSNISRFMPSDHSDIKALQREFDGLSTALLANIQLTSPKCITAGPPTNVSNIVITVVREKRREFPMLMPVIKRRYVDCRLGMMDSTYVKRLLTSVMMTTSTSALQIVINVDSHANSKISNFRMVSRSHVQTSVYTLSMNPMIPTAVAKSNPVPFAVSSVHGTVPWATTSMGFTRTQFICASKTILVGKCANPQVSARWSRDLSQLTPFIAAYMTPLAIPSSPKMLGGSVAASLFLKIAMLPTSAKHLALSVDTFASCPTVTRKGSTKPPMDRCKKPFGALKVQRGPRLRWKDIGSEPRKAGLRSYVSCTANISAGTRTSIYVAIPLHIAKKRIQNTRWNEFSLNRTFLKIGFRIGCTGREWALKILTRELIKLSSHFAIITVPVYVLYDQSPTFVSLPCFALTSGPEHAPSASNSTGPSYCTLPIFHPPLLEWEEGDPSEHVSNDGHHYKCPDPATLIPAFHVIFVLDRSSSMLGEDRQPLRDQPIARRIAARQNNRFGAVLSALYQFLQEQNSVLGSGPRRDAYSTIVFNHAAEVNTLHDLNSPIDQLVQNLLGVSPQGWTSFREALLRAREVMEQSWSTERSPVVVFLSDGEDRLERNAMEGLCNRAVALGTPLSFWSISFGPRSQVLQEMANIARDVARQAARGTGSTPVPCDFRNAINTVQLANTFSNIGTSLRKGRASLINPGAPAYTRPGASNTPLISL